MRIGISTKHDFYLVLFAGFVCHIGRKTGEEHPALFHLIADIGAKHFQGNALPLQFLAEVIEKPGPVFSWYLPRPCRVLHHLPPVSSSTKTKDCMIHAS